MRRWTAVRADGEQHGTRAVDAAEAAEVRPAPPPVRRGVRRNALEAEDVKYEREMCMSLSME